MATYFLCKVKILIQTLKKKQHSLEICMNRQLYLLKLILNVLFFNQFFPSVLC